MLRCVGKLIKSIFRSKHSDGCHIEFRVVICVFHHLLVRDDKSVFMVFTDRMADHRFPNHGAESSVCFTIMFNRRNDFFYMADANYNTPGIFHKRNLLCIGNAERFIFCNIAVKIFEYCFLVICILHPHGVEF